MGEARSRVQASLTTFIQSRLPNRCAHRTLIFHANASCRPVLAHGAPMTAGTVISSHDQVRLKAGWVHAPFKNFIPRSLPNSFAYRTLKIIGHMHPDDEIMVRHVESYMLACGTAGHAVQQNESSSNLALIMLSLSSHCDSRR